MASLAAILVTLDVLLLVAFFVLYLSSGKHPVVLFNCSIDSYVPISDETIDTLCSDAFNLLSLRCKLCAVSDASN